MGHIDIECLINRQSIKMKFVVAFLACIVAAQAATFSCPSYDYWCAHNFHVLPRNSYYCYRIHFNHAWCTGAYYRDILVEFPKTFVPNGSLPSTSTMERTTLQNERILRSNLQRILPPCSPSFHLQHVQGKSRCLRC